MSFINLRNKFGNRYRIEYDEAHTGRKDDPWLQIIVCKYGHLYVHGADMLGVSTNVRGQASKKLRALQGIVVLQEGDDGMNAAFPIELFPNVPKIVKPRRKKQLTGKERRAAVERLSKHRFSPARQNSF